MRQEDEQVRRLLKTRVIRLNGVVTGLALGFVAGLVLFLATNFLILKHKEGEPLGPHLGLLGQVFIGYSVSFVGSIIGFLYAFVVGMLFGYFGAALYNWVAALNQKRSSNTEQ